MKKELVSLLLSGLIFVVAQIPIVLTHAAPYSDIRGSIEKAQAMEVLQAFNK